MQVPRIFNPRTNVATPSGGYLQVQGQSVQNTVGESLQDISRTIKRNQDKAETFDVSKRLIEEANALQLDFDAKKEAAPLGAQGFTEQLDAEYAERHAKLVENYAARGYSREAVRDLDLRLASMRQGINGQAIAFQDQSYKGLVNKETGDAAVQLSQYATQNPMAVESALTELQVLLKNRPGIEATDAQQLYDHYSAIILNGAGEGLALYDPQTVVNLLAPEETTTSEIVSSTSGDFNIDSYMAAARGAESSGDDRAKASTSSATGRYQFLNSTWVEYYNRTYPNNGLTEAQIKAKRTDGAVQDAVMKTFTLDNVKFLESNNIPVTNASVYLSHFLGQGGARSVYTAAAGADIRTVLDPATIKSNPAVFKQVKTVSDMVEFAQQKVGDNTDAGAQMTTVSSTKVIQPGVKGQLGPTPAPSVPVVPGNFPVDRGVVQTEAGAMSDKRTVLVQSDIGTVLVPREVDGELLSEEEAVARFRETGEHLGTFKDDAEAATYAKWLYTKPETDLAPTGNPVLDRMTGPQRMDVLNRARAELSRNQAQNRAGVDVKLQNEMTARLETGEYAGEQATDEEIIAAYGPVVGAQKIAERESIAEIGPFVKELQMLSPAETAARLEQLRPTDTASPTYATELRTYELAEKAAKDNLALREADPIAYSYRQFNNVAQMFSNARNSNERKAAYAAMQKAQDKLGMPKNQQGVLTKSMAEQEAARYQTLTPQARVDQIEQWASEMPGNMLANTLTQLSKTGIIEDVQLFGIMRNYPNGRGLMLNVFAGMDRIEKDKALRPGNDVTNGAYRSTLGSATISLNPEAATLYRESANALYVQMGGQPGAQFDQGLYANALRQVVGGVKGQPNTGIINMGGDKVPDNTILPPGINKDQFESWIEGLAVGDLTRMSLGKKPPRTATGKSIPTQDIIDFGVFVMTSPGRYIIKMNNTGGTLIDGTGAPFVVAISPAAVRGRR